MLSCFHNMKISHKITLGFLALILLPLVILLTYNFTPLPPNNPLSSLFKMDITFGQYGTGCQRKLDSVETITQSLPPTAA